MKTKDLMLGDIITFKDSVQADEIPIPVKVVALGYQHHGEENEALVRIGDNDTCDIVTIDEEFVGYPLTVEILEKNGFRKLETYGTEKWLCDNLRLNVYSSDGTWRFCADTNRNENSVIYIRFVHELQNALWICGIEKEIEL